MPQAVYKKKKRGAPYSSSIVGARSTSTHILNTMCIRFACRKHAVINRQGCEESEGKCAGWNNGSDAPRRSRTGEAMEPMPKSMLSMPPPCGAVGKPARMVSSKLMPYSRQQRLRMKYVTGAVTGIILLSERLMAASENVRLAPHWWHRVADVPTSVPQAGQRPGRRCFSFEWNIAEKLSRNRSSFKRHRSGSGNGFLAAPSPRSYNTGKVWKHTRRTVRAMCSVEEHQARQAADARCES